MQIKTLPLAICLVLFGAPLVSAERPRISEDRELKEIDLRGWDCRDRLEGSAKTPDGIERNRLKNRTAATMAGPAPETIDTAAFLRHVNPLDAQTQGKRRKDLSPAQISELEKYEQQLVSFTGYLVLAYAGPPESTNCGSTEFHDWHLEVFAAPSDHPPRPGDPTPIICEITPRNQSALFRDGVRLQSLAAFIRAPDSPTSRPAIPRARFASSAISFGTTITTARPMSVSTFAPWRRTNSIPRGAQVPGRSIRWQR